MTNRPSLIVCKGSIRSCNMLKKVWHLVSGTTPKSINFYLITIISSQFVPLRSKSMSAVTSAMLTPSSPSTLAQVMHMSPPPNK